jgi:hypothetical protein
MELKNFLLVVACFSGVIRTSSAVCTADEQAACQLPDCLCPSTSTPGELTAASVPQIVMFTFDDAANIQNYPIYEDIFFNPTTPRVNPNGYPITASFYITHEYNDYSLVHQLWRRGHDIALHSISHRSDTTYWKNLDAGGWKREVVDQKQQVATFAKIPFDDIKGFRAPFLQGGGDVMMGQIFGELQYDCSRPTRNYLDPALWPYTLNYDTKFQDCQIAPCPENAYPGFWVVPMVDLEGGDGFPCAMIDTCLPQPNTTDSTLYLLKKNFLRHYEGNRAPFGVYTHAAWLSDLLPGHRDGYVAFLDYLATLDDVYVVSVARALDWVRNPTALDTITSFAPWQVVVQDNDCSPTSCRFPIEDTPGFPSERYMTCCTSCPNKYPWLDNPLGDNTFRANKFDRS